MRPAIEWGRYGIADQMGSLWSMDARHAEWIKAAIQRLKPNIAVEVGCHLGVSTLAILEAGVPDVRLIDTVITPSVRRMAEDYGAAVYRESSETALPKMPPLKDGVVLLDGDHSYAVVSREASILNDNVPRVIIAHDVSSLLVGLGCEGCIWLWHMLQAAGWLCYVDCIPRSGERTNRGVLIATRRLADHEAVTASWLEVCGG
jgi:hypothetical protein